MTLREFLEQRFTTLDDKTDLMLDKQDKTNERLQSAERSIAVLSVVYTIGAGVIAWIVYRLP